MTKEVLICGNPTCCTKVNIQNDGSVIMAEANTGKSILIPADDWKQLKEKIISGEL